MKIAEKLDIDPNLRAMPAGYEAHKAREATGRARGYGDSNDKRQAILKHLQDNEGQVMNSQNIAAALGVNPSGVTYHLHNLKKYGRIRRIHIGNKLYTYKLVKHIKLQKPSEQSFKDENGAVEVSAPIVGIKELDTIAWAFLKSLAAGDDEKLSLYAPAIAQFCQYVKDNPVKVSS